jgi:hypothetical protein
MELTGNPFVDVGLGIAAARMGHQSIQLLSHDDLQKTVGTLHRAVARLKDFKILAAFWVNNPFMGKNLGQKPKFVSFLNRLEMGSLPTRAGYCQVCGRVPVLSQEADRCWFPLAAGRDSDPCTLPGLRGKVLCADCLSAVIVLPLGCRSCPDGPYFVHMTEPEMQVQAAAEGVEKVNAALAANTGAGIGHSTALRGRVALLDIASGSILWDHSQPGHVEHVPRSGATMISFSNRGNGASFNQLHLPAEALEFFGAIAAAGLRPIFLDWAREIQRFTDWTKRRSLLDELCGDVERRRSFVPSIFALVRARKTGRLQKEERKVIEIYEDVALRKKERFDALQRVANKIRQMPGRYSESFVKQLGNLGSKRSLLDLVKDFCKRDGSGLKITPGELRAIIDGPANETTSLLYLLCVAEDEGENG